MQCSNKQKQKKKKILTAQSSCSATLTHPKSNPYAAPSPSVIATKYPRIRRSQRQAHKTFSFQIQKDQIAQTCRNVPRNGSNVASGLAGGLNGEAGICVSTPTSWPPKSGVGIGRGDPPCWTWRSPRARAKAKKAWLQPGTLNAGTERGSRMVACATQKVLPWTLNGFDRSCPGRTANNLPIRVGGAPDFGAVGKLSSCSVV